MNKRILAVAILITFAFAVPRVKAAHVGTRGPAAKINVKALLHNSHSLSYRRPFGAVPAGTAVTLRLRTAHHGVSAVTLEVQEITQVGHLTATSKQPLKLVKRTSKYDTWQTVFTPTTVDFYWYDFLVKRGSASLRYADTAAGEGGVGQAYKGKPDQYYRITAYDPSWHIPSWAPDMVIYQIFPDRFFNGDPSNDNLGMHRYYGSAPTVVHQSETDDPAGENDFFGGDLQGVIDKLPYLRSLGVTTIYLNPIFLAPSNHKYDTANYLEIDPRFGTQETFENLAKAIHDDGMHLILDGVFNHTGSDSVYFNEYGTFPDVGAYQSKDSPYYPWYSFTSWPTAYQTFFGVSTLPQLQENDPVKDFIFRKPDSVAQHWLNLGADGWRLDAAHLKSHQWWQEFRQSVKARFPDTLMICECDLAPIDAAPWLLGNELDGAMNYRFRDYILGFFAKGIGTAGDFPLSVKGFFNALYGMIEEYPLPAIYSSMNLVGSHDTDRILDMLGGNKAELKEVAAFQATWLGAPTIYYGDEAGLTGNGSDPLRRRFFPWSHPDTDLQAWYAKVFNIRNANPALRDGTVSPLLLDNTHRVLAFLRADSKQRVVVVLNDGTSSRKVTVKVSGVSNGTKLTDQISGTAYTVSGGKVSVTVVKQGVAIMAQAAS